MNLSLPVGLSHTKMSLLIVSKLLACKFIVNFTQLFWAESIHPAPWFLENSAVPTYSAPESCGSGFILSLLSVSACLGIRFLYSSLNDDKKYFSVRLETFCVCMTKSSGRLLMLWLYLKSHSDIFVCPTAKMKGRNTIRFSPTPKLPVCISHVCLSHSQELVFQHGGRQRVEHKTG